MEIFASVEVYRSMLLTLFLMAFSCYALAVYNFLKARIVWMFCWAVHGVFITQISAVFNETMEFLAKNPH